MGHKLSTLPGYRASGDSPCLFLEFQLEAEIQASSQEQTGTTEGSFRGRRERSGFRTRAQDLERK